MKKHLQISVMSPTKSRFELAALGPVYLAAGIWLIISKCQGCLPFCQHLPLRIINRIVKATIVYFSAGRRHMQGPRGVFSLEARALHPNIVVSASRFFCKSDFSLPCRISAGLAYLSLSRPSLPILLRASGHPPLLPFNHAQILH